MSDLGEGEPERHQDGAVDEVLDLDAGSGPHAEDVPGRAQRSLSGMKSIPCCSTWNASSDWGRE